MIIEGSEQFSIAIDISLNFPYVRICVVPAGKIEIEIYFHFRRSMNIFVVTTAPLIIHAIFPYCSYCSPEPALFPSRLDEGTVQVSC